MNSFLLNRSQGSIRPSEFHTAQCTRLVHGLEPAPGIRFTANPTSTSIDSEGTDEREEWDEDRAEDDEVCAHKAGANVLAIDQYEKR